MAGCKMKYVVAFVILFVLMILEVGTLLQLQKVSETLRTLEAEVDKFVYFE